MPNRIASAALAAIATLASAAPAAAQPTIQTIERVPYGDLDLSTPRGARAMLHRIQAAVSRACLQSSSLALSRGEAEAFRCRSTTLPRAIADLGAPLVTARYARSNDRRQMAAAER